MTITAPTVTDPAVRRDRTRNHARAAGIFYLLTFVVLDPRPAPARADPERRRLRHRRRPATPACSGAASSTRVNALTAVGSAVAVYAVVKRQNGSMALGLRDLPPRRGGRGHDRRRQPARGRHDAPGLRRLRCRRLVADGHRQRPGRRPELDLPVRPRPDARLQRRAVRHAALPVAPGAPHHPDRRPDRRAPAVRRVPRRPLRCHRPGLGDLLLPDPAPRGLGAQRRPLDDLQGVPAPRRSPPSRCATPDRQVRHERRRLRRQRSRLRRPVRGGQRAVTGSRRTRPRGRSAASGPAAGPGSRCRRWPAPPTAATSRSCWTRCW